MSDEQGPVHSFSHVASVPLDPTVNRFVLEGLGVEPDEYSGWEIESLAAKRTAYIGDWSPVLLHALVSGTDATRFFSELSVNSFDKFAVGRAKHVVMCNTQGKVMGEGILMKTADDGYHFTSTPGVVWATYKFNAGDYDADFTDVTGTRFIFQVQGPKSLQILEEATGESLRDIPFMGFAMYRIAGAEVRILRQGMAGELGYELHGNIEDAINVWNAVLEYGAQHGIERQGARARMINHVEASFPTPGVDFIPAWVDEGNEDFGHVMADSTIWRFLTNSAGSFPLSGPADLYYTPFELGWGRNVKFDHEFIGRAALEAVAESVHRQHVTLVWNSEDCAEVLGDRFRGDRYEEMPLPRSGLGTMRADAVEVDGRLVGASVSRCYSPVFRQMISLAVVDAAAAEPGTEVTVIWGSAGYPKKAIRATVAPAPYKKDRRRVDVHAV